MPMRMGAVACTAANAAAPLARESWHASTRNGSGSERRGDRTTAALVAAALEVRLQAPRPRQASTSATEVGKEGDAASHSMIPWLWLCSCGYVAVAVVVSLWL